MPFCAHWWLILSRLLAPKRTVYFLPGVLSLKRWELRTCYWGPDWKARSRGSSSPAQARAAADTALAWFVGLQLWTPPNAFSDTALSTTQPSSTEYFRPPPAQARTMSQSASSEHQNGSDPSASQMNLYRQCFPKVADPNRGHNKLLIKSSRWTLLWLLSFTIASNLFFYMCGTSGIEMLNSFLCFLCQTAVTMLLWLYSFLHKCAPYSLYMFCKKLGSDFFLSTLSFYLISSL